MFICVKIIIERIWLRRPSAWNLKTQVSRSMTHPPFLFQCPLKQPINLMNSIFFLKCSIIANIGYPKPGHLSILIVEVSEGANLSHCFPLHLMVWL